MVREVSPKAFWPAPRVDSAVLHIELRPELTVDVEEALFMRLVKFGFAQKRKQLKNTLSVGLKITSAEVEEALLASDLKATARAQELSLEEWSKLYRLLLSKLT
jgi:16S rRNA (adenine1518-N6/adenine1519-N6)-dimethyltransferase